MIVSILAIGIAGVLIVAGLLVALVYARKWARRRMVQASDGGGDEKMPTKENVVAVLRRGDGNRQVIQE